ncbi:MAG TPA: NADH-quinone oxidoreductase subunit L [Ktedonobacteraceae bacterium]|nr:NADH-quinone oxidoreductase subunit L [Ktedonobacteraceae bacterium]
MVNWSIWVLLLPLLGFVILGLLGRTLSRGGILTIAWAAVGGAFLFALLNFFSVLGTPAAARVNDTIYYTWVGSGNLQIPFGQLLDPLSATMLLIITGVGLLIHIYSAGYMEDDPGFWRFFAYMNFFVFAMVLLVTADNFLFLLIGWGLVGLASFLLIGFWFQRPTAVAAARKALVINIIGDFGLMLAIFLIFIHFGTLNYLPNGTGVGVFTQPKPNGGIVEAICLLLFLACTAKSAQLPLYMWLPDAMEGPTPVSALIHAATMVTAGVYLVARANPLFQNAPVALGVVAGIGGVTALFAASIAIFQLDIKRVLAYSTISQLGYMFLGEGVHNYSAGIFHLTTHAYFKALLFLGAGVVIHALNGQQDMRAMGGLRQKLPVAFWTFLIAALAISGIPPLSGFWSKDDILSSVLAQATTTGNAWYYALWGIGLLTAGLTAFYMFRLFFGIFAGDYRGANAALLTEEPEDEEEGPAGHHGGTVNYNRIHEAGPVMTVPLVILAGLSIIGGLIGSWAIFSLPNVHPFETFLSTVFPGVTAPTAPIGLAWISTGLSIVLALLGILGAWALYGKGFQYRENNNPLYQFAFHKYYVDEALETVLIRPIIWVGREFSHYLEGDVLDGGSRKLGSIFRGLSSALRRLQSGFVRNYALAILVGVLLIVLYYAIRG